MRQMAQDAPDLPVVGAPITSELAELELQLSRELAPQPVRLRVSDRELALQRIVIRCLAL